MSGAPGPAAADPPTRLLEHALRLHRLTPDEPLPRAGKPYPDDGWHPNRAGPRPPRERHLAGVDVARILDAHFDRAGAPPSELAHAFHGVYVPCHPNDHITAAAERADRDRARETGRWLVRRGTDRCAVTVGLGLVAAVGTPDDIPLVQTIGLLSGRFGPLAAHTLRRLPGGGEALLWLAERVAGWGRVYVVEALCRLDDPTARPWLLRRACDGDVLNGYFVGEVATATALHEALGGPATDSEMVDHAGRLLDVMSGCDGMGTTLALYPHARVVLEAHARLVGALSPSVERFFTIARLAEHLTVRSPEAAGCTAAEQRALRARYLSVLDRDAWTRTALTALSAGDRRMRWLADHRAPELLLRGFPDRSP